MPEVSFICKECGSGFSIPEWRFRDKGKRLYCSKDCRIKAMQGSKNWTWKGGVWKNAVRNKRGAPKPNYWVIALEHYSKLCNRCFSEKDLHVHHIDRNRNNNDYKNLEILCRSCHAKEHKFGQNFRKNLKLGASHGSQTKRK